MNELKPIMSKKRGMSKKAQAGSKVAALIGAVIVIVLVTAVAPTMFNGLDNITGAPTFANTVLPIIVAAGLIMLVWRTFN